MKDINEEIKTCGHVQVVIDYRNGERAVIEFPNTILQKGRQALASSLANDVGSSFNFFVARMLFGDGGTTGGSTKFVDTHRNGLFGITRANKPVISQVDPNITSQVIFTSVVSYAEANGYTLNEMALQMNTGDLYSMVTFPDLTKTEQMQITWNWRLSFV